MNESGSPPAKKAKVTKKTSENGDGSSPTSEVPKKKPRPSKPKDVSPAAIKVKIEGQNGDDSEVKLEKAPIDDHTVEQVKREDGVDRPAGDVEME